MTSRSKRCTKCGEEKPIDAFSVNRSTKDGRAYYCRKCFAMVRRSYGRARFCTACEQTKPPDQFDGAHLCFECAGKVPSGAVRYCPRCHRYKAAKVFDGRVQCRKRREYKAARFREYYARHTPPRPTERELVEAQKLRQQARIEAAWDVLAADRLRIAGV